MKIFIALAVYQPDQLQSIEARVGALKYAEIVQEYDQEWCSWATVWRERMERCGFCVDVAYHNWKFAQLAWARENAVSDQVQDWHGQILCRQVEVFKPDAVFLHGWDFSPNFVRELKTRNPCIKYVVRYDGVARHDPGLFDGTDVVLAPLRETAKFYDAVGMKGHLFKIGFNALVLPRISRRAPVLPVTFIGSVRLGGRGHNKRLRLLDAVCRNVPVELRLAMQKPPEVVRAILGDCLKRRSQSVACSLTDSLAYLKIWLRAKSPVYGVEMYQYVADSGVSLNCHIDAAGASAANMRLFEATGVGSCLVTDWKDNLSSFFEPDREVVTFKSAEECVEKLRYLADRPDVRRSIAEAGQRRTLRDHNMGDEIEKFGHRLASLL